MIKILTLQTLATYILSKCPCLIKVGSLTVFHLYVKFVIKNDHFLIRKTRIRSLFSWFNADQDDFEMYCPNCGDIIELDFEEYLIIKPILKLNEKLENKTITWDEFDYKLANTLTKIKMKHKQK